MWKEGEMEREKRGTEVRLDTDLMRGGDRMEFKHPAT